MAELLDALASDCPTIQLTPGAYHLAATISITRTVTLTSGGAVGQVALDGQNSVRVLRVEGAVTLTLVGLNVTNGNARSASGGGISAINGAAVVLLRASLSACHGVVRTLAPLAHSSPMCSVAIPPAT